MTNPVLAALAQARFRAAPIFARWCELNGTPFCPTTPATVARFVKDCSTLGIERLWPAVQDISRLHASLGLADPTLGGAAAATISDIAAIPAPRSWPDSQKQRFKSLPYDFQVFVAGHEARREKALRKAQNEAAATRQKLAKCEQDSTKSTERAKANEGGAHENA